MNSVRGLIQSYNLRGARTDASGSRGGANSPCDQDSATIKSSVVDAYQRLLAGRSAPDSPICDAILCDSNVCDTICDVVCDQVCDVVCDIICDTVCDSVCDCVKI